MTMPSLISSVAGCIDDRNDPKELREISNALELLSHMLFWRARCLETNSNQFYPNFEHAKSLYLDCLDKLK